MPFAWLEGYIELDLFSSLSATELEFIFGEMTACVTRLVYAVEGLACQVRGKKRVWE